MKNMKRLLVLSLVAIGVVLFGAQNVLALTPSGETILNTATLTYEVGGFVQNTESDAFTFWVDTLVLPLVTNQDGGNVTVTPNQTTAVSEFLLTNNGNATQDFVITLEEIAANDFTLDSYAFYQDDVDDDTWTTSDHSLDSDGGVFYVDNLAAGDNFTIYVVSHIPLKDKSNVNLSNLQDSVINLKATAHAGDTSGSLGSIVSENNTATDDPLNNGAGTSHDVPDVVFGDEVGTFVGTGSAPSLDEDEDGEHSAAGTYVVQTALLTVTKNSNVLWDPFSLYTNPKRIPGALVVYTITISNAATNSVSANLTQIADILTLDTNASITFPDDFVETDSGPAVTHTGTPFRAKVDGSGRAGDGTFQYFANNSGSTGFSSSFGATTPVTNVDTPTITVLLNHASGILPVVGTTYEAGELLPDEEVTIEYTIKIQ